LKALLFANTAWYLHNFRLPLAQALRALGHEVVLVSPGEEPYHQRLQDAGFESIRFPLQRRNTQPVTELVTLWKIYQLYRQHKPDAVHHFTIKPVLYGSLAAHAAGTGTIINAVPGLGYVFITQSLKARLLRVIASVLYRLALRNTRVIFQNPDDQSGFVQAGLVTQEQSHLIRGSGVDVDRFLPAEEPPGETLVVLPARILWDKGVAEFVEAARMLKAEGICARFALAGAPDPGNPSSVPQDLIEGWQGSGQVEWWGWCDDMLHVYHAAHILCLPSFREGTPRSLIEAAACGRAIVTTDVPGCREVVRDGENGLLVPPRDAAALADALRTLIQNPSLRQKMGAHGRQRAVDLFSSERVIAETLTVYNSTGFQTNPLRL
jgi:glycosyltransferase involved in cell wall biosynthesis